MATCYENIVGIRGICDGPNVRFYVDDYGVSLKTAANIADERYITGRNLFEAKRRQAWQYLLQDVVLRGYKNDSIIKSFSVVNAGGTTIPANGNFSLDFSDNCELTGVFINDIQLNVVATGTLTIRINGEIVYNATPATGVLQLLVGQLFPKQILVEISGSATVSNGDSTYYRDGGQGCYGVGNTYGISITGDYRCNIEQYLCRFPDKIGMALTIKTAALLYKEMLSTSRLAEILFVKDRAEIITEIASLDSSENLFKYDDKAFVGGQPIVADGKYQKQIEYINRVIPVPKCRCCMDQAKSSYNLVIP